MLVAATKNHQMYLFVVCYSAKSHDSRYMLEWGAMNPPTLSSKTTTRMLTTLNG